jgi:hypothetical protein
LLFHTLLLYELLQIIADGQKVFVLPPHGLALAKGEFRLPTGKTRPGQEPDRHNLRILFTGVTFGN